MCKRYTHHLTWPEVVGLYRLSDPQEPQGYRTSYNVAPTQTCLVIRKDNQGRNATMMHWGLIPFWSQKKPTRSLINAQAETLAIVPSFRGALQSRRCLVPASGFYEWQRTKRGGKRPYWIGMADLSPFAMAGLWEFWVEPNCNKFIYSFAIITTKPNELLAPIHDRMPVILHSAKWNVWLGGGPPAAAPDLLRPYPVRAMRAYPISARVNDLKNDDPTIIQPAT